jgi:hypothetical protein
VSSFAKKTGDYSNLSSVDLLLVALTYQLCKENLPAEEFAKLKLEPSKNFVTESFFFLNLKRLIDNESKLGLPIKRLNQTLKLVNLTWTKQST